MNDGVKISRHLSYVDKNDIVKNHIKKGVGREELTTLVLVLGLSIFTWLSWLTGGVPLAGHWSVTTKAFDVCESYWALNLITLCSVVSTSVSSAFFLINAD